MSGLIAVCLVLLAVAVGAGAVYYLAVKPLEKPAGAGLAFQSAYEAMGSLCRKQELELASLDNQVKHLGTLTITQRNELAQVEDLVQGLYHFLTNPPPVGLPPGTQEALLAQLFKFYGWDYPKPASSAVDPSEEVTAEHPAAPPASW